MSVILKGGDSSDLVSVDTNKQLKVALTNTPSAMGGVRSFSENDTGDVTGEVYLLSSEVDEDFRLRVADDTALDEENFNYLAQNTGKFSYATTTMTNSHAVGAMSTNSGNITTVTTGTSYGTYAHFPLLGTNTLAIDIEGSFSAQPVSNTVIDFGGFLRGAANPYAPTDGAYFRLTSAGLQGVVNYNGVETLTSVFPTAFGSGVPWAYTNSKKYQFILYASPRAVSFWINDNGLTTLMGRIDTPVGNGQPFASSSLPFSVRHAIVGGAASGAISFQLSRYNVRTGWLSSSDTQGAIGNRLFGSYQGLSGGTMGSLANYANSANPTAAVPTNTTAALGVGLGGQFWETASLAVNTDGIICSYQNPIATASVQGRRLRINGIWLSSYIQTVIAGAPFNAQYSLAFGHTAVSLATAEGIAAKAPRRIPLPAFTQLITAAQAVNTMVSQPHNYMAFTNPIYVNPSEFVALVTKHVGTVGTTGTIAHTVAFDYGWE